MTARNHTKRKQVFRLWVEGLPLREIAKQTGKSHQAVQQQLSPYFPAIANQHISKECRCHVCGTALGCSHRKVLVLCPGCWKPQKAKLLKLAE